jgi:hypothetical protein
MPYFHPKLRATWQFILFFCLFLGNPTHINAQCPTPTSVGASNIQTNVATISWSYFGTVSSFEIELLPRDSAFHGIPTKTNITQSPYVLTNLKAGTLYKYFIRSVCGFDRGSWAGPYIFRTYLPNPSPCNMKLPVGDFSCDISNQFPIQVQNAPGTRLGDDVILKEVKLLLKHTWASDMDMSLVSPAGDTLILTQDNGGQGQNFGDPTTCTKTCDFVYAPYSCNAKPIAQSGNAPFVGKYTPVGDMRSIHKNTPPNGLWKLLLCDDAGRRRARIC